MLLLSCSAGWMQLLVSMLQVQSNDKPGEWAQNNQIPVRVPYFVRTASQATLKVHMTPQKNKSFQKYAHLKSFSK